jgi:hypothetical protein
MRQSPSTSRRARRGARRCRRTCHMAPSRRGRNAAAPHAYPRLPHTISRAAAPTRPLARPRSRTRQRSRSWPHGVATKRSRREFDRGSQRGCCAWPSPLWLASAQSAPPPPPSRLFTTSSTVTSTNVERVWVVGMGGEMKFRTVTWPPPRTAACATLHPAPRTVLAGARPRSVHTPPHPSSGGRLQG